MFSEKAIKYLSIAAAIILAFMCIYKPYLFIVLVMTTILAILIAKI